MRRRRTSLIWSALAFVTAAGATTYLAVAPVYSSGQTLADVNGLRSLMLPGALVLVAALPLMLQQRRHARRVATVVSAILLAAIVVLGGFSIGLFFVPAAICALVALGADLAERPTAEAH